MYYNKIYIRHCARWGKPRCFCRDADSKKPYWQKLEVFFVNAAPSSWHRRENDDVNVGRSREVTANSGINTPRNYIFLIPEHIRLFQIMLNEYISKLNTGL